MREWWWEIADAKEADPTSDPDDIPDRLPWMVSLCNCCGRPSIAPQPWRNGLFHLNDVNKVEDNLMNFIMQKQAELWLILS